MSYCRFFEADAYLIGTYDQDGAKVIECVSCRLRADSPLADQFPASGQFTTYGELLGHIGAHRNAGHRIPRDVDERILEEANSAEAWLATGELPERPVARSTDDPEVREHIACLITPIRQALAALVDDVDARAALAGADPALSTPIWWTDQDFDPGNRLDLLELLLMELNMLAVPLTLPRPFRGMLIPDV